MIGKLRGFIDFLQDDKCIIDVNGVGYVVFISNKTAQFLRQANNNKLEEKKQVSLIIETIVKEDAIELYGFATAVEKIWFLELTKVQGVGAKVGLKILAFFTIDDLARALISGDMKAFSQISGIGPKLAQRITTELKESPKKLGIHFGAEIEIIDKSISDISGNKVADDALSALENLGYKKADSLKIIAAVLQKQPEITLENLITNTLRELSKRKL